MFGNSKCVLYKGFLACHLFSVFYRRFYFSVPSFFVCLFHSMQIELFNAVARNGYKVLYLSARAIGQVRTPFFMFSCLSNFFPSLPPSFTSSSLPPHSLTPSLTPSFLHFLTPPHSLLPSLPHSPLTPSFLHSLTPPSLPPFFPPSLNPSLLPSLPHSLPPSLTPSLCRLVTQRIFSVG